jgi:hypothetical protein
MTEPRNSTAMPEIDGDYLFEKKVLMKEPVDTA